VTVAAANAALDAMCTAVPDIVRRDRVSTAAAVERLLGEGYGFVLECVFNDTGEHWKVWMIWERHDG
jgi:hypothetical protein